ncbi:hypothetical protein ACQKMV_05710 [Lysinibacillus sp. NPDC094403]|uniref:hypothetical protein n=1 Tax=Lysinibacillus sp. NPDC094403 TaxID=3390581 RepID=UPI003D03CE41
MRELSLQIANEFRHLESESEATTLNFLTKGDNQDMSTKNEKLYATIELDLEVTNLTKDQFIKGFYDFVSQLQSKDAAMDFKAHDARLIETLTVDADGTEEYDRYDSEVIGMVI